MFFDLCTDRANVDMRGWGPCPGVTIDNIALDNVTVTGDIQTEHTFACAFDADGDLQGWVSSILEDSLNDATATTAASRALGFRNLAGAFTQDWAVPAGWTLGNCGADGAGRELILEVARLCGPTPGAATTAPLNGPDPTVGDTITIPGGYRAISWNYLRETRQDPGDGSISSVIAGNQFYAPGSGFQYQQHGWEAHSDSHDSYRDPITFTVSGDAHIEILIVREAV